MKKLISIFSLIALLAVPAFAFAGFTMVDHPDGRHDEHAAKIVHVVEPGATIEDSLVLENTEETGVSYVKVKYTPSASSGHVELPVEWIKFKDPLDKVAVKAGEFTYLDFVIKVPEDAAEAKYQMDLVASGFSPDNEDFEGVGVDIGVGKKLRVIVAKKVVEDEMKEEAKEMNNIFNSIFDFISANILLFVLAIVILVAILYFAKLNGGSKK